MSLGLGDLKKKRRSSQTTAEKTAPKNTPKNTKKSAFPASSKIAPGESAPVTNNWSARSRMARPWSDNGLSRPSRRRHTPTDGAMSPEWLEAYSSPMFGFNFLGQSSFFKVQAELMRLEATAWETLMEPLALIREFLGVRGARRTPKKVTLKRFRQVKSS